MSIKFNADEIYEIAERIEINGEKFYTRAAELTKDSESRKLLELLANMEKKHRQIFADMHAKAVQQNETPVVDPNFDRDNLTALYLNAIADGHIFNTKEDPSKNFTGKETMEDILQTAMTVEKDSVAFYLGMKEMVPENLGKEEVEQVIKEEMSHIAYIAQAMKSIKQ
ncbi:rubrerythrin [Candidatus Poribacteria bacterium]|nr:rubrerythrin [Candidatus Poribacteria bacterium]